jgi:hypothetical protein
MLPLFFTGGGKYTRHSAPILSKLIIYEKNFKSTFNGQ